MKTFISLLLLVFAANAWPQDIEPAPPLACPNGVEATCNPVNDLNCVDPCGNGGVTDFGGGPPNPITCPDGVEPVCNPAVNATCAVPCPGTNHPDDLVSVFPVQPPCPEGAGYVEPGWLGNPDPYASGCVWLTVPSWLRSDLPTEPLLCFLDETLRVFEVWTTCSPFSDPTCTANCRDLAIYDGIATSPPSLALRNSPLKSNLGELPAGIASQREVSQVQASCGDEGEIWYDNCKRELDLCINPPAPPAPDPAVACDEIRMFNDGRGGSLWKPFSDNTGNPVILLDRSFDQPAQCDILFNDGTFQAPCFFRTCCPNSNRAHWDVRQSCTSLVQNSIFRLTKNGVRTCWVVTEPCSRLD